LKQRAFLILFFFLSLSILPAQEEDPELEEYKAMLAEYGETGIELFVYYPVSYHLPGWSYPSVHYKWDVIDFHLPGPNISLAGLGLGAEVDFGSRKLMLQHMGIGGSLEYSSLEDWNMRDDADVDLVLTSFYLFYRTQRKGALNFSFNGGLGLGRAHGAAPLFTSPEEKEDTAGPLYQLQGALILPPLKNLRFQLGLSYRFLAVNTMDIHIYSAFLRAGIRF